MFNVNDFVLKSENSPELIKKLGLVGATGHLRHVLVI